MQVPFKLDRTEPTLVTSSSGLPPHHYSSSGETWKTNVSYFPVMAEFWKKSVPLKGIFQQHNPSPREERALV